MNAMDTIELGGNIQLNGFAALDGGQMIILKKIIGNYTKKLTQMCDRFEQIKFTLTTEGDPEKLYALVATLYSNGQEIEADSTHKNLFMAVDYALKQLESKI